MAALEAADSSYHALPVHNRPLVTIESDQSLVKLDLRDLWSYRELLYFLMWRDIKVRYKQTLLGAAWAIIQPLFTMLIFALFFGKLVGVPSDNIPYPLFAYSGLLLWMYFANAVVNSGNSLIGNANLITKVYFPRMLIPASAVAAGLMDFAISSVILCGLLIYYGVALSWNFILLPILVLLLTLLALGIGMWMSALNVKYRDIRYALPFVIQLWMFISPIIYPLSVVPQKWRWVLAFNPLTGIIEGFRALLFGRTFDWKLALISTIITFAILLYSAFNFRRMEQHFADAV